MLKVITIDNVDYIVCYETSIYRENGEAESQIYKELVSCINEETTAKYNYSHFVESGLVTEEEYHKLIEYRNWYVPYVCFEYEKTKDLLINYYQKINDAYSINNTQNTN